jgi:hypothetical protein
LSISTTTSRISVKPVDYQQNQFLNKTVNTRKLSTKQALRQVAPLGVTPEVDKGLPDLR